MISFYQQHVSYQIVLQQIAKFEIFLLLVVLQMYWHHKCLQLSFYKNLKYCDKSISVCVPIQCIIAEHL